MVLSTENETRRRAPAEDPERAWAPYEPDDERPWNLALAGHLYRRAGFGATWSELQRALADGPQRTVDALLRPTADTAAFDAEYDEYDRQATGSGPTDGVRVWWLRRMIATPHPLRERMVLFWHGRLAADAGKVKEPRTMQRHVALLRRHALGSYRALLEDASRDPALLLTVGAEASRRKLPAEGFARALLGSLTIGPDHFTEEDVREAARAFTGTFVRQDEYRFVPREHDDGVKRLLGRRGPFTGDDVVALALEHPAASRNVVRALYRWLIAEDEEPAPALTAPLERAFTRDGDVGKLVETMLRSRLFFAPRTRLRRVKGPVELAVGLVRTLEGMVSTKVLAQDVARLGQSLLHPPTVKGWAGGRHWIDRVSLLRRHELAGALVSEGGRYKGKLNPARLAKEHGYDGVRAGAEFLRDLLLPDALDPAVAGVLQDRLDDVATRAPAEALRRVAHVLVTLPEYRLA